MKTTYPVRIHESIFPQGSSAQPVRLIKAAQAGRLIQANGHAHVETQAGPCLPKDAQIRLLGSGPGYSDMEVHCGCGETVQVRCWQSPAVAEMERSK